MISQNFNLTQIESISEALGSLLNQVTFVGGSTTILLVDEVAHHGVRHTKDVDVIIDIMTKADYYQFARLLREQGFREDSDGPICRWVFHADGFQNILDVMPISSDVLGFSNRWYKDAIKSSSQVDLPSGKTINVVSPAYFLATKFEAFKGRGKGNYFSHDMEDIIFVLENRKDIIRELLNSPNELKVYFSEQAASLLNEDFLNVLPGLLLNSESDRVIINFLKIMRSWNDTEDNR